MFEELYSEPRPAEHQQITGGKLKAVQTAKAVAPMMVPIARPKAGDPATSWNFFHPNRVDARFAPADFRARVHAIDQNLDVVWHPIHERWCVWVRNPHITHWMCAGWQMLFPIKYGDGSFMPLDDRVFAMIYDRSPRKWGNAKVYFDRILDEIRREKKAKQQAHSDIVGQHARDRWDFAQIKVAMRGKSNGSKFQKHHSGN